VDKDVYIIHIISQTVSRGSRRIRHLARSARHR